MGSYFVVFVGKGKEEREIDNVGADPLFVV
jgi:hypothetical protein